MLKILLSITSLALFVLIIEGFFMVVPIYRNQGGGSVDDIVIPDSELIWRLKPYTSGPFTTNELGLRDAPYNRDADLKILLLGDSVSWGDGIQDIKLTYPCLLEQGLSAARGKSVEVINSAVPGYSTFQELSYLQQRGLQLSPDLIIVQFCLNDVVERYSRLAEYGGDNIFIGIDTRVAVRGLHGWLLRHSRAYEVGMRLAVRLARDQQEYHVEKLTVSPLSSELQEAWARTFDELDRIRQLAEANRIPLVLLVTPYHFQLQRPEQSAQPQQRLAEWARSRGVMLIDLLPPFAAYQARHPDSRLFFDPSHLTIEGHALTAELLAVELAKLLRNRL